MVISIEDAQEKFKPLINEVLRLENDLLQEGIEIKKSHDFELSEEWDIYYKNGKIGWFMWNVPHMISLTLEEHVILDSDYINGAAEWKSYLDSAHEAIRSKIKPTKNT